MKILLQARTCAPSVRRAPNTPPITACVYNNVMLVHAIIILMRVLANALSRSGGGGYPTIITRSPVLVLVPPYVYACVLIVRSCALLS